MTFTWCFGKVARASKNKPLTDNKEVGNVMPMFTAEPKDFPFVSELPRREKSKVRKAWDLFLEYKAAMDEHGTLIPCPLVAKVLNVSKQRVEQLYSTGVLQVVRVDGHPLVTEDSLVAWANSERDKGGRPRKDPGLKETWKASVDSARGMVVQARKNS